MSRGLARDRQVSAEGSRPAKDADLQAVAESRRDGRRIAPDGKDSGFRGRA